MATVAWSGDGRGKNLMAGREAEAMNFYQQGMGDSAIGRAMSLGRRTIETWRKKNGLPLQTAILEYRLPTMPPKKNGGGKFITDERAAQAVHMVAKGMTDAEIGAELGCCSDTILQWRRANNIPRNDVTRRNGSMPFIRGEREDRARKLKDQGKYDWEIAKALGCTVQTVASWRKRKGIERAPYRYFTMTNPTMRDPLYSRVTQAVGRRFAPDIVEEAVSDIVLAVLSGEIAESDIERVAAKRMNRAVGQWANRYGPASLDEDRNGEGWTRYTSIADPAQEDEFRIIELIALAERLGIDAQAVLAS